MQRESGKMELNLSGKTALVTGSYRGTGLIIAKTLIDEGVNVFVHGLDIDQANSAVSMLGAGIPVSGNIDIELHEDYGKLIQKRLSEKSFARLNFDE